MVAIDGLLLASHGNSERIGNFPFNIRKQSKVQIVSFLE